MEAFSQSISKLLRSGKRAKQSSGLLEELCRRFSLAEIKRATNNFDKDFITGRGYIGTVYKGSIDDRTINVAIRSLSSRRGFNQFRNELLLVCQLSHPNLVPLIGYCLDEREVILVYEFMPNGSLGDHLFVTDSDSDPLPWKQRLQICIGVACGLHYLHAGVKHCIIHRNVKASKILLDKKWEAKLSDLGISKMGPPSLSKALIRVESESKFETDTEFLKDTYGYLDPEYIQSNQLTDKSDVYSFGVVLLEVLCGRKAHPITWVQKCIREGTINQIIDPYLMGKIAPECFKIYMDIATSCVRTQGAQRPTICEVEVALEHALQMQESADLDPGIGGAHQYMYPILEYTPTPDSPPEEEESIWYFDSPGSVGSSLDIPR